MPIQPTKPVSPVLHLLAQRSSRPGPALDENQARAVLMTHYGITGELSVLGSQQDLNLRVDAAPGRFVLKACHESYDEVELQAQHAALGYLRERGVPVPSVRAAQNGESLLLVDVKGQPLRVRLLEYIDGQPLTRLEHMPAQLMAEMGSLCARLDCALADFHHPASNAPCNGTRNTLKR